MTKVGISKNKAAKTKRLKSNPKKSVKVDNLPSEPSPKSRQMEIESESKPQSVPTPLKSCKIECETDDEQNGKTTTRPRCKKLIAFIGNLAYDTTDEQLRTFLGMDEHIVEIRLPRNPQNKDRIQGYAFCEFNHHLAFRKCLLMHHSELEGRRINIELTAGGGGNSQNRKKKITKKNSKAGKWRIRRVQKLEQNQRKQGDSRPASSRPPSASKNRN